MTILKFWCAAVFLIYRIIDAEDIKCIISKQTLAYIYKCPLSSNREISLFVEPPGVIEVRCTGINNANDMALPSIDFGKNIEEVRVYQCPIPKNGFIDVLQEFHIEKLQTFSFYDKSSDQLFQIQHFQGLQSINKLRLADNNVTDFDGNIFRYTPRLTYFEFVNNNLSLYDGLFRDATLLISIYLSNNSITYLPRKVFSGLRNLLRLHIKHNKITFIEHHVFRDLVKLEDLFLEYNLLQTLDVNIFEFQGKLEFLDLENNILGFVSRKIFINCTNIARVRLGNNKNLILENMLFSELLYLNYVNLKKSSIRNLPDGLFKGSINLFDIILEHNDIEYLPTNIFKELELLDKLYLNNNRIKTIHRELFAPLKSLRILNIGYNFLSAINEGLLKSLNNLEELDLSFNQIHVIDSDFFSEKVSLVHLWINNNRLDLNNFVPHNLKDCKNIKLLDFSSNSISSFPFMMINSLLKNEKYKMNMTLPRQTENRERILMNLKNNNISQIKFNEYNVDSLTEIITGSIIVDISKNPITCDCQALDLVLRSQSVDLNEGIIFNFNNVVCNDPQNLANTFVKEVDTNELTCSLQKKCTKMNECDCFYRSVTETIIIDCSNRNFSVIPQLVLDDLSQYFDFVKLNRIEIHLEDNLLEEGPTEDDLYYNVTELYLQRNVMEYMNWVPPHIEVLNVDHNELKYLEPELITLLNESDLRNLTLSHNPWRCDCKTKDFVTYLWTNILKVENATDIRCNIIGKALIYLDEEELCPTDTEFTSIISSVILICFIMLSAFVLVFLIYEKEILIWLYARDTCLWMIKEERIDKNKKYDAFVSFAHQDEEFVMDRLLPILELGSPPYKFCVHIRDWIPGEYIATQISNSVRDSKRTLIILSPNFIQSVWGRMEFRTAHTSAMKEGRVRIILIIYGDVEMDQLDEELKAYIRTNTYIKWGDPWFWEKLRYALPRTRNRHRKDATRRQGNRVENDIELHL